MASVDDIEELIATRRLNGVDDGLYESDKNVVNMTEEAFNEIIDNFEVVAYLTEYGRRGIKENVKRLQKENEELKEENQRLKAKIDVVNWQEKTAYQCLKEKYIPKQKIKEIVDECIPKEENIITEKIEYRPNTNANSFLTQQILELLQESEDKK